MRTLPSTTITLDRERVWRLDVPAFERACDGFEEVGLAEFAENPLASLEQLNPDKGVKFSRKMTKILRVWIWAGLTSEDESLKLADISKFIAPGDITRLAVIVLPVLTESILGRPIEAAEEKASETAATTPLADCASG